MAETGATEFDAHFKTRVKLSWTCWYKQAGQVRKVEGELHLTGIIKIPMETACRHELTVLFYSEKWLHDNHILLKIHYSLFDLRYNFSLREKALIILFLFLFSHNMLSRVVDVHTRINITRQTTAEIALNSELMHFECKCGKIWHRAERLKKLQHFSAFSGKQTSKRPPFPNFRLIL